MAFIMLVFRYSEVVSISVFVFSEIEAEVERLKISLKNCQLVVNKAIRWVLDYC